MFNFFLKLNFATTLTLKVKCGLYGSALLSIIKHQNFQNRDTSNSNIRTYNFIPNNLTKFGSQFLGLCLLHLVDASCGFGAHDTTSPVTTDLWRKKIDGNSEFSMFWAFRLIAVVDVLQGRFYLHLLKSLIVVGLDGFNELRQCTLVLTRQRTKLVQQGSNPPLKHFAIIN